MKAHIATGCDWISKLGTKSKALSKVQLLDDFGECELNEDIIDTAEEYLVSVLKGKNEFRYYQYVKCSTPVHLLVPSSYCVRNGHIMRMFYLVRRWSSLLNEYFQQMDPTYYGWEENNGFLLPKKYLRKIPKNLVNACGCKHCSSKNCGCRRALAICTIFCECGGGDSCTNIYNNNSWVTALF